MNKDLKSLRQLAVPLLFLALCVAVQRSDSAVSAFKVLFVLLCDFFFVVAQIRSLLTAPQDTLPRTKKPRDLPLSLHRRRDTTGSPEQAQLRFINREAAL